MTVMGARCTEQNRGLKASTTFRNVHCVGRWIQRNILGLNHTTSFNRPVLQIIHDLMTRQHTICINKIIFHSIITNSSRTRGAKYSHPVLITRLCRTSYHMQFLTHMIGCSLHKRGRLALTIVVFMRSELLVSSPKMSLWSPLRRNF